MEQRLKAPTPLGIGAYTLCTAVGDGRAATLEALRERRSGLVRNDFGVSPVDTWIGRVAGLEQAPLPHAWQRWDSRNNRLAWRGLQADGFIEAALAARERYGAGRVALVLGTSTSSIGASEEAYRRLEPDGSYPADLRSSLVHTPHSLCAFVQHALGLAGIAVTVATACSSSAKVFAHAARFIHSGLADAAIVGGVDTLCGSVLFGFNALELLAPEPCRPFDAARRGISLGEAAGFALLERDIDGRSAAGLRLLGCGESSDAHHMSAPHPQGLGAQRALQAALRNARLAAGEIDYINLHGTASRKNDEVEAQVVAAAFAPHVFASSTKGWTGHTLGAAGIVEAAISLLALEHGLLPGTLNAEQLDAACGPQIRRDNRQQSIARALSFSFGFGGSNCVLAFGRGGVQ